MRKDCEQNHNGIDGIQPPFVGADSDEVAGFQPDEEFFKQQGKNLRTLVETIGRDANGIIRGFEDIAARMSGPGDSTIDKLTRLEELAREADQSENPDAALFLRGVAQGRINVDSRRGDREIYFQNEGHGSSDFLRGLNRVLNNG